ARSWHGDRRQRAVGIRDDNQIRNSAMGEVDQGRRNQGKRIGLRRRAVGAYVSDAGLVARVLGCTAISACSKSAASRGEGGPIRSSYWARSSRPSAINHAARFSDFMRLRSYMI